MAHHLRNAGSRRNIECQTPVLAYDMTPKGLRVWSRVILRWNVHLRLQLPPVFTRIMIEHEN
jgi:hypothetical protein